MREEAAFWRYPRMAFYHPHGGLELGLIGKQGEDDESD
jgi:hypothetical protein